MPNHETHDLECWIMTVPATVCAVMLAGWELAWVFAVACLFGGLMFSPDLDHHAGSTPWRRWWILRWVWWPYSRVFKHRSWATHLPIAGTVIRLAYLALLLCPVWVVGEWTGLWSKPVLEWWVTSHRWELLAVACGLEFSSLVHITADWCS
jgi:uncharacterized metal-binding protein